MTTVATLIQEARVQYPNGLDGQQLRDQNYGFLDYALRNTDLVINDDGRTQLENSWNKPDVEIPVMVHQVSTMTQGPMPCDSTDTPITTAMVTPTWDAFYNSFHMVPRQSRRNMISYEQELSRKIHEWEMGAALYIDQATRDAIDTAKATTSSSAYWGGYFSVVADAAQITQAQKKDGLVYMKNIFMEDQFSGMDFDLVGSHSLNSEFAYSMNQGAQNAENLTWAYNGIRMAGAHSANVSAGANATGFMMVPGSMGIYGRTPADFLDPTPVGTNQFSIYQSPVLGLPVMVIRDTDCIDGQTVTNRAYDGATRREKFTMGVSFALLSPYKGTRTNSGIKKLDIVP